MIIKSIVLGMLAFASSAFAAENCAPQLAAKPFLYRLESANGSFLVFGTRHAGVGLDDYPTVVREVIDTADQVILETKKEPGLWFAFRTMMALQRGSAPKLSEQLTRDEFTRLVAASDLKSEVLDRLSVFGASMMCLARSQKIGFKTGQVSLDDAVRRRAKAGGKRVAGLEKSSVQLTMMKQALDLAALRDCLAKTATTRAEEKNDFLAGDEPAMQASVMKLKSENYEFWKTNLADRNDAWVPKIEKAIARPGRHLLVVGVNHLFGPRGLLELFRSRGFKVTRVED